MGYIVETGNGGSNKKYFEIYDDANKYYAEMNLPLLKMNAVIVEAIKIGNLIFSKPLPENISQASCMAVLNANFDFIEKLTLKDWDDYISGNKGYVIPEFDLVF